MFSSPLLTHPLDLSFDWSPKNKYLSSRRLYELQAKISVHTVELCTAFFINLKACSEFYRTHFVCSSVMDFW